MYVSRTINNIAKLVILIDNGDREMKVGLFDGGEDSEHNDTGFVEVSKAFVVQHTIFFGTSI